MVDDEVRAGAVGAPGLSHLDARGAARMVDVGAKPITERSAVASGRLRMRAETCERILAGDLPKGDVLATARIAGIQAAKETARLIPLCHPLPLTRVSVEIEAERDPAALRATATVAALARTGVEMEALSAVSIALLTLYDMAKSVERGMWLEDVGLLEKRGGSRGDWRRPGAAATQDEEVAGG